MSLCKIQVIGNVGKEIELRYTSQGTAIADFSVAVNDKVGEEKVTTWFKVTLFGKQAEYHAADGRISKGDQVYIDGRLQFRTYEDKSGTTRTSYEIVASDVQSFGKSEKPVADKATPPKPKYDDSEIPF